jgi:CDP-glucose 4,6-dehydratase
LPFPVVTARAGNVIGGGDQALNRIVPDLVRAWSAGETLHVRRPTAVRPWQHVIEPLEGYLLYGEAAANRHTSSRALNFGPSPAQSVDVASLVEFAACEWQRLSGGRVPTWEVESNSSMPETDDLTLDPALAREALGWAGFWGWREAIARTLEWYISVAAGEPPLRLMQQQFADYASR